MLPPTPTRALLLLLAAAAAVSADDKTMPDYLHICKRSDPQLVECVKESIEILRPRLATGIEELNVPAMEPLFLKQLVLNENPTLRVYANDIEAYKTTSFQIQDLKVDPDKGEFSFHLFFPGMNIVGTYAVDGRILLLPIKGSGPVKLNITNVEADVVIKTEDIDKESEKYMTISSMTVRISVGSGTVRLENLFGGDRVLGEVVNTAVNANFDQALKELKPSVERALEKNLGDIAKKIFLSYPSRQIFPDN